MSDLANQKVNVDLRGAGTAITGSAFDLLKILIYDHQHQEVALDNCARAKLPPTFAPETGPIFRDLNANDGLIFLPSH